MYVTFYTDAKLTPLVLMFLIIWQVPAEEV